MFVDNPAFNICLSVILLILAYLFGSIPFGLIIGKLFCKKDIREYGSKNIGSTNAIRVLGLKVGIWVFVLDVLKGALFIIITKYVLAFNNIWISPIPYSLYGIFAVIGHVFPIYLDFKGGKAVATSLGVALALTPIAGVSCLIIFGITLLIFGYVSLSSTCAAITVLGVTLLMYFIGYTGNNPLLIYLIGKPELSYFITYLILACLIFVRHKANYKRLVNHTENSFKLH